MAARGIRTLDEDWTVRGRTARRPARHRPQDVKYPALRSRLVTSEDNSLKGVV
ncbi:hypothetical protein [Streptomyces sp. NPDC101776]|uniref:hypothetical protein n=1 Tax=Streptomyces sp. NPDC101776 TaxID=3366146 RepID=UPI00382ED33A